MKNMFDVDCDDFIEKCFPSAVMGERQIHDLRMAFYAGVFRGVRACFDGGKPITDVMNDIMECGDRYSKPNRN